MFIITMKKEVSVMRLMDTPIRAGCSLFLTLGLLCGGYTHQLPTAQSPLPSQSSAEPELEVSTPPRGKFA